MNNKKLFEKQLEDVLVYYPNLQIVKTDYCNFLKGVLDIPDDNKSIVGSFLIEIHYSDRFPFQFPILYEIGGDIPNEPDWHKYPDSRCCITVWTDEIVKCNNGITVIHFLENYAIPYFANQIHRKITGEYRNGEYSHGETGIFQFYEKLMKTSDKDVWIKYFNYTFRNIQIPSNRNDICFCGSNIKFKRCHLKVFDTLRIIGENQLLNDFKLFLK